MNRRASQQHRLITAKQLGSLGFSDGGIYRRVQNGRLFRLHRGVFALHPPPYDRRQQWLAAVLACGEGALLSDLTNASLWGASRLAPRRPQVTVRGSAHRAGIEIHRRVVVPADRTKRDSIPCVSMTRTLVDLAPVLSDDRLETILIATESLRLLNRVRLGELLSERVGRPGMKRLAALAELKPALVRSDLEPVLLSICREWGIRRPEVNEPVEVDGGWIEVDFSWPDLMLAVETDGRRYHGGWKNAETDTSRDQLLSIAGWQVIRFTWEQLHRERARSGHRLKRLFDARAAAIVAGAVQVQPRRPSLRGSSEALDSG